MKTSESLVELLFERLEAYGKTTFELSKLKLIKTTSAILPSLISRIIVVLVISMFALIFSVGIALLLGESLNNLYYGFFIVAAFYLVIGIVLHFYLHKWIKKPISDSIIKQLFQ